MKCYKHNNKDAVGQCSSCNKGVCDQCSVDVGGKLFCRDCAASGKAVESPSKKKDPTIALLLGLIPIFFLFAGIGQIYVGRMKRGLAILLCGWGIGFLNLIGLITVYGLCLTLPIMFIFIAWQAYDAYKLAQEYNTKFEKTGTPPW
jgi:TM2 domain-containing membrane protein YozV